MANLDIFTPLGQESLRQERLMLEAVQRAYGLEVIETDKDQPCEIDGILVRDKVVVGVFESKCRKLTRAQMRKFQDTWLVTFDKVLAGLHFSKLMRVPYYGLLYLTEEPIGLMIQISDSSGSPVVKMQIARTETRRTVNGGLIERANAYIDLSTAYEFEVGK